MIYGMIQRIMSCKSSMRKINTKTALFQHSTFCVVKGQSHVKQELRPSLMRSTLTCAHMYTNNRKEYLSGRGPKQVGPALNEFVVTTYVAVSSFLVRRSNHKQKPLHNTDSYLEFKHASHFLV